LKTGERLSRWPFLFGLLLYTVGSVDYVIIPFILRPLGLSFSVTFLVAVIVANLEIIAGFHFWKWFTWKWLPTTEPVKETIELAKSIFYLLKKYGLLGTIVYKVRETYRWATGNSFSRFINSWGHLGMFALGAESFISGGRLVGTILCASTKWKNGLYSLGAGNIIHVAISVWTWNLFFYLWSEYKGWFTGVIIVTVLFVAWRHFRKSPKRPL